MLCTLYKGRKNNTSYIHVFGCKWFLLNKEKYNLGEFNTKVDEGLLLEYSTSSKAFKIFNKWNIIIEE